MSKEVRTSVMVARRLLASIVITPAVAVSYTLGYALLVANGAGQTSTLNEVITNGIVLGVIVSLAFTLSAFSKK